jgi:hypothetical protein
MLGLTCTRVKTTGPFVVFGLVVDWNLAIPGGRSTAGARDRWAMRCFHVCCGVSETEPRESEVWYSRHGRPGIQWDIRRNGRSPILTMSKVREMFSAQAQEERWRRLETGAPKFHLRHDSSEDANLAGLRGKVGLSSMGTLRSPWQALGSRTTASGMSRDHRIFFSFSSTRYAKIISLADTSPFLFPYQLG